MPFCRFCHVLAKITNHYGNTCSRTYSLVDSVNMSQTSRQSWTNLQLSVLWIYWLETRLTRPRDNTELIQSIGTDGTEQRVQTLKDSLRRSYMMIILDNFLQFFMKMCVVDTKHLTEMLLCF